MPTIFTVDTYQYYNFSSRDGLKSVAILRGANNHRCNLFFHGNDRALEPAYEINPTTFHFNYQYSDFADIIDMLRNEKPVYVMYEPQGSNNSRISTGSEPVGEGEEPQIKNRYTSIFFFYNYIQE